MLHSTGSIELFEVMTTVALNASMFLANATDEKKNPKGSQRNAA